MLTANVALLNVQTSKGCYNRVINARRFTQGCIRLKPIVSGQFSDTSKSFSHKIWLDPDICF